MIRKISKHGQLSLSISLPIVWVRMNKLKGNEELDVKMESDKLIISPLKKLQEKEEVVEFKESPNLCEYFVAISYRYGTDLLRIKYPPIFIKQVNRVLSKDTIGFEVIDQTEDSCKIKDMSKGAAGDFDAWLRRMWLVASGIITDLENPASNIELILSIPERDNYINRYRSYLIRLIMKNNILDKKSYGYVSLIQSIEALCDEFKNIAENWENYNLNRDDRLVLKYVKDSFGAMQNLFYSFSEKNVEKSFGVLSRLKSLNKDNLNSGKDNKKLFVHALGNSFHSRFKNIIYSIIEINHNDFIEA